MTNVIESAFAFFIIIIGSFLALTILTNSANQSIGGCYQNASGSIVNCSLSNDQYYMVNATSGQFGTILVSFSPIVWVLAIAVIIAVVLAIGGGRK